MKIKSSKSGIQGENPPVLTGGLKPENMGMGKLINVSIDWLSVTVGETGSSKLMSLSEFAEDGRAGRGFKKSERRLCWGGDCWRRWEPRQSEKKLGFDKNYESWEFVGYNAEQHIYKLIGVLCKPTRIDIAFDYQVEESYLADYWREAVKPYTKKKKLSDRIQGQDDINTRYVGSKDSERFIRIYRKDYQDITVKISRGPVLRIELVLRGRYAEAFWEVLHESGKESFNVAASYITDMAGFIPIPDNLSELPVLEKKFPSGPIKKLYYFVKQYANYVKVLQVMGVDLQSLIDHKHLLSLQNKVARHRFKISKRELSQVGADELVGLIHDAIERGL